ncbi:cAMP-dependent protein kinase type II regulatory subunit isoform X2 [Octopus sinensis]|nr:cAMP-dependent protein kinase type II regulatory subunit isoform X2 [Octopus sinensis]
MSFEIPPGLTELLQGFTVSVLRERPANLIQYAADYFTKLNKTNQSSLFSSPGRRKDEWQTGLSKQSSAATEDSGEDDFPPEETRKMSFLRRKSVCAEAYDPEQDQGEEEVKVIHPKNDEQRKRLNEATRNILLFRNLEPERLLNVVDAMFERKVEQGEKVIHQGDDGDNFYVIDSGQYDVYVEVDGRHKKVGEYDGQGFFGELALMYNVPRAATVVCSAPGSVWALDRVTFRRIVLKDAFNRRKMYTDLIESVPLFSCLDNYEKLNIADALHSQSFEDGEVVLRQGDDANCMYFVEDGEVSITVKKGDESVEVKRCGKGSYFGELALLTHKPRAATATSMGHSRFAVLSVGAFERLLGPCMEIMKRNIETYEEQLINIFGSENNISDLR